MADFDQSKAQALANRIMQAEDDLTAYLSEHFPKGARCEVFLRHGQKTPTPATIRGVGPTLWGGEVRVEIDTAKPRSRQRIRSISAELVINVSTPAPNGAAANPASVKRTDKTQGEQQ